MKHRYLLALTLSALLLAGCTGPAQNEMTETSTVTAETTAAITTTELTTAEIETVTETSAAKTTESAPEKLAEKDIGGGYSIYVSGEKDAYTLHLADENGETDSMSITNAEYDWHTDCYWQPIFYDFDLPPCFSVYTYTGDIVQLHYRTYFAIDGKIREAEWYLDGEKLDSLNYSLLRCYGNGDSFNAYLPFERDEDYSWLDVTKCTFTFDESKLRFEGTSQCPITHKGTAEAAADALDELTKLRWELRTCECSDELVDDCYTEITADGLRTQDEFMDRLHKFCTKEAAEKIFTALFEGEYKAYDGKLYRVEGALNPFTYMIIDNVWETDNGITAKIYSYAFGQDRPHYINPPLYIEFVQEDGVWKIASMPTETPLPEADPVMRPIPSGEPFEVMSCEITELPIIKTEEDFPDQAALKLAKEICYNNETEEIASYNEMIEKEVSLPIETAEDVRFVQGVSYDFDSDGENESVISLHYTPEFMGGGYCVYVDEENYKTLMSGGNTHIIVNVLDFDGYIFMQLYTTAGAIAYSEDIYSFENGIPETVLDIEHDSHSIRYENGVFYCYVKYDFTEYPFVFCTDGKFRQLAIEEITPEDFEAHVTNGGAYLDTLDNLETIYTSGYYAYWFMCGDEEWYLSLNGNGVYEESKAYGYADTQFTDELIYGKDVWSAVPISTPDPTEKIWNFLSTYESPDLPNKYFLFDFNGDDFPEVAFVGWDEDMFHKLSYPYMTVYDLSGSEPVSLGGTSQGLSPYSDDKECIGLYCNDKGEYFYHSLAHYVVKDSNGYSYNFERFITPVDFDNHIVEFTHNPTEQRNFDNESDAEKYKERVWKELEQCTLVTELKTSYLAMDNRDKEAFLKALSELPQINYVTK